MWNTLARIVDAPFRLPLSRWIPGLPSVSASPFHTTAIAWAEPMKKKKKLDPALVKLKEERKKRKVEKNIRRLLRLPKQLKPLIETEIDYAFKKDIMSGVRDRPAVELSREEEDRVRDLCVAWTRYRRQTMEKDYDSVAALVHSQTKALKELEKESKALYDAAIQVDNQLVSYFIQATPEQPACYEYKCATGNFQDTTRKWE